jgi:hypothetical protein
MGLGGGPVKVTLHEDEGERVFRGPGQGVQDSSLLLGDAGHQFLDAATASSILSSFTGSFATMEIILYLLHFSHPLAHP